MSDRPVLLFVSPRFLFPTDEGGKIRSANILRQMKGGIFRITLASPVPPGAGEFQFDIDGVCDDFLGWPVTPRSQMRRVFALLDGRPVSVATDDSREGRAAVACALNSKPDLVLVDFPHGAVLAPSAFDVPSVCFTHNIETEIYERHARAALGIGRILWPGQARKMQRFEGATLRRFDRVIAVSRRDAKALTSRFGLSTVDSVDTGVDLDYFRPTVAPSGSGLVVFTGVMDSPANIDGVRFLMHEVWPILSQMRSGVRACIIGRNPPKTLQHAAPPGFEFTGTVDDIRPHFAKGDLAVIPLNIGSGTRIKAFEAMAMGRPVVSTTIGVEGLEVTDGEHLLIADDAAAFAVAIDRLLADAALRSRLATRARALVEDRFSWARVARQFEAICLRALGR